MTEFTPVVDATGIRAASDLPAVRDAVLEAVDLDAAIMINGGGTKARWGAAPRQDRPWLAVDTGNLDGLVRHDPGDMTATVQAGVELDRLCARLAEAGQELAVDPPRRAGAPTVGGVFAANDAGPRRLGYGGIRDLVIGVTVVLADGTVARSGGTVIKNVAGYDLGKLLCGSLGTLGIVAELTLRLHPVPEAHRTVRIPASGEQAVAFVTDLLAGPVECAALEWSGPDRALLAGLEGRAGGLAGQVDGLVAVAGRHGLAAEPVDGDDGVWDSWREAHAGAGLAEPTVARAATLPADLAGAAGDLEAAAEGVDATAALYSHAALGLHDAIITGGTAADHARVVAGWRERIRERGGTVVLRERRAGVDHDVDPWDTLARTKSALMRSVKTALDPDHRMAPGRFVGGI